MARAPKADSALDRLYQLPLGEFIAARNALAKESGDAAIKSLAKPNVPAWAVNQLYWRRRDVYDALAARAEDLRATHLATLQGKRADLRGASRDHEQAVEAALKATLAVLAEDGQPATDATRQAIATTLRGLPGDESPGRLTRPIEPRGFEMIAAGPAGGGKVRAAAPAKKTDISPLTPRKRDAGDARDDAAEKAAARERAAAAREALAAATRAMRIAEQAAKREEFEAARTARDADKAGQRVGEAEQALEAAKQTLADAKRDASEATKAHAEAQKRAARAQAEWDDLKAQEEKAREALT